MFTEQLTQALSIAAKVDPQTLNNSSVNSGSGVDSSLFHRLMAVVSIGNVTSGGSLSIQLQGASSSGGSFSAITNATATAITASGKVVTIEVRSDELTDSNRWVKVVLTETAGFNVLASAVLLGGDAGHSPAAVNDISAVAQRLIA